MDLAHRGNLPKMLDLLLQKDAFLLNKVEFLSLYNKRYSELVSKIIILFEYLHLISQGILIHFISNEKIQNFDFLLGLIVWIFKLVDPSYLLPFEQTDSLTTAILFLVFSFTILKYILFIYTIYVVLWGKTKFVFLMRVFQIVMKIQGRIICFFVTSFCVRTITTISSGEFKILNVSSGAALAISGVLIGLEYMLSFLIEMQFCYLLPTKNFLSSKDYQLQVITLIQKLTLQVFQMIFPSPSLKTFWLIDIINLIASVIRNYHFYTKFPLYKFEALVYQGDIISIVISLNISCFIKNLLDTLNYSRVDVSFIVVVWLVIAFLMIKISREYIKRIIIELLTGQIKGPPELLLHKVNAFKQIRRKETKPNEHIERYDLAYLLNTIQNKNVGHTSSLSQQHANDSQPYIDTKKETDKIFLLYLKGLSAKFPKNSLIKLNLAQQYAKDLESYSKAIKTLAEFRRSNWSKSYLNSLFLLCKIQKALSVSQESNSFNLDLVTYIKTHIFMEDLKKNIKEQIDLRISICNNITGKIADTGEIFNFAQLIGKSKKIIEKKINILPQIAPDYYIEPLLICAQYYLILNYSLKDYKKYSDIYTKKLAKYEKYFNDVSLNKENLFQDSNAFLIISGQKTNSGEILFCNRSVQNIVGAENKLYEGSHISRLFTPIFQNFYDNVFKQLLEAENKSMLNNVVETYLHHKDNHIVKAEFYLSVHPFVMQNLYLNMIIRPVPSTKEYILVKENGDIEGATKNLCKRFAINTSPSLQSPSSVTNLKVLSGELYRVNIAFNMVHKAQSPLSTQRSNEKDDPFGKKSFKLSDESVNLFDYSKAFELYENFSSKSQIVEITSPKLVLNKSKNNLSIPGTYYYWCNISILPIESIFIKIITLEEAFGEEDHYHNHYVNSLDIVELDNNLKTSPNRNHRIEIKQVKASLHSSENIECWELGPQKRIDSLLNTNENLLTPKSCHYSQAAFPLLTPKSNGKANTLFTANESPQSNISEKQSRQKGKKLSHYLSNSHSAQRSQRVNMYKLFRRNLDTKSYPRSFNLLCIIFYGVILITLASQIILKITTANTMNDLDSKKNILKYSQLRLYRVVVIQIVARGGFQQIAGRLTLENLGGAGSSVKDVVGILESYRKDLVVQNNGIISGISSLDQDIREQLFARDIRIRGSTLDSDDKTEKNVTHFIVIDEIVSAVRRFATLTDPVSLQGYHALNFIVLNTLNDFVFKNNELTNLFLDFVQKQKDYFQTIISIGMIISPCLLVGIDLMLAFIIWKQYFTEKGYMLAFIKLDQDEIKDIVSNLKNLKKGLNNEENIEKINSDEFVISLISSPNSLKSHRDNLRPQVIKLSKTRKRYLKYTFESIVLVAILVAVTIWNYGTAQSSSKLIYKKQNQLELANYISSEVTIIYTSFVELFNSNNTNLIKHQDPFSVLSQGAAEMKRLRSEISERFSEEDDDSNDPHVEAIVFKDNNNCQRFTLAHHLTYCRLLVGRGQLMNLISLVASFEIQINDKLQDYINADKSSMSKILAASYINIDVVLPTFSLIAVEAQLLVQYIDKNLQGIIFNAQYERSLILVIFSVSLIMIGFLIWFQILIKLREINNDFKKVLQVIPAKLILSSFPLKRFLHNTFMFFKES